MKALISFFVRQRLFANLFSLFLILTGLGSAFLIQREFFPNVSFEVITVRTIYPGASSADIEKKITSPLEEDLKELDGVRKMLSISSPGTSVIVIELDPDEADEKEAKDDVQDIVNRFDDLPKEAERPIVEIIESKLEPVVDISVSGIEDPVALRNEARRLELLFETRPGVARVEPRGLDDKEIRVEILPEKMKLFNIGVTDVFQALAVRNVSLPGGRLEAGGDELLERIIRTTGEFTNLSEIEDAVVRANDFGKAVRVKDVAKVSSGLKRPDLIYRANGERAVSLTVLKKEDVDGITIMKELEAFAQQLQKEGLTQAKLKLIDDKSFIIENRLNILTSNLFMGVALIVLILTLFLSFRVSLLVSFSLPLCFLGTLLFFYLTGISLNVVSLIGLIIVVGLLTDNAVVVADNIAEHRAKGVSIEEAAILGTHQVFKSIFASTLTTVIAFVPMLFMTGIFGKIIAPIPIGVIVSLMFSWLVSFLILPAQYASFIRDREASKPSRSPMARLGQRIALFWTQRVSPFYERLLFWVVSHRYKAISGLVVGLVLVAGLLTSTMRVILFPPEGVEIFFVRTTMPVGTSLREHSERVKPLEEVVRSIPKEEMQNFVTFVGSQSEGVGDPESRRGDEYAQITVFLTPETARDRSAEEIIDELRGKIAPLEANFREVVFKRITPGPPVGKPVSLGVRGQSYEEILAAVEGLKARISKLPGVRDLSDSYNPGKKELQVIVDYAEASAAGLTVESIGLAVLTAFEGLEATSIRDLIDETKIRVQLPLEARKNLSTLKDLRLRTPSGELVPLSRVAKIVEAATIAAIEHEGTERQVRVLGEIDIRETTATLVNDQIRAFLPEFQKEFPRVTVKFGGEDQDTRESFEALGRAFVVAFFGIFIVLVLTFGQLLQPLLILITVPFGAISVLGALFLHGKPISFMGMLGVIALAGVIVNNAIVLIDFVNQGREEGLDRFQSIYKAGSRRLKPIFLTTLTTIIGVLPTAYGLGGLDRFVIPIALSLGWGLAIGSVLTAIFFPASISILDDFSEFVDRVFKKRKLV